jgi:hypothetical protein
MHIDYFFMLVGILFVVFILHLAISKIFKKTVEGMTVTAPSTTGVGVNSTTYATTLQNQVANLQDTLLVSKYQSEYESILVNLEELLNLQMLNLALSINPNDLSGSLPTIQALNTVAQANASLNAVMKALQ